MARKGVMEVSEGFLKRKIGKTKRTYENEWILFQEALQNSLDAIYKSGGSDGKIHLVLNLNRDEVTIVDNGVGFPHDVDLLLYGGSNKDEDDPSIWKYGGTQGVGLKVVYFSSENFELESIVGGKRWTARIRNGHKYLESEIHVEYDDEPTDVSNEENGTTVRYRFPSEGEPGRVHSFLCLLHDKYGDKIDDCLLSINSWLELALRHYLQTETYAANVKNLLGISGVELCTISVEIAYDMSTYTYKERLPEEVTALLESGPPPVGAKFTNKYWDLVEAVKLTKEGVGRPTLIDEEIQPSGRGNQHNTSYIWHQKLTDAEGYESLLKSDYPLRELVDIERFQKLLFPQIMGVYIMIGSTDSERVPRYLLGPARRFVSARGIPTEHSIQNPTGVGELGYVPYIHFVVDVPEELNEGKRTISNTRLIGLINEFFRDCYRVTLRNIVTRITGRVRRERRRKIKKKERTPSREIIDLPNTSLEDLSVRKIPIDETTVIALFYELIGKGHLRGYKTYANYHGGQYDARGILIPTGDATTREPERDSDLDIFEFKKKLSEIINDFDDEIKDPNEIELIVCWEDDVSELDNPNYQVVHIEHSEYSDDRFHRVAKVLRINEVPAEIRVLVLSESIEEIRSSSSEDGD